MADDDHPRTSDSDAAIERAAKGSKRYAHESGIVDKDPIEVRSEVFERGTFSSDGEVRAKSNEEFKRRRLQRRKAQSLSVGPSSASD